MNDFDMRKISPGVVGSNIIKSAYFKIVFGMMSCDPSNKDEFNEYIKYRFWQEVLNIHCRKDICQSHRTILMIACHIIESGVEKIRQCFGSCSMTS
jgi:hypothetical protein